MFILFPLWHKIHGPDLRIPDLVNEICNHLGLHKEGCKFCEKQVAYTKHTPYHNRAILLCRLIGSELENLTWIAVPNSKHPNGYSITVQSTDTRPHVVRTSRELDKLMKNFFLDFGVKIGYFETS